MILATVLTLAACGAPSAGRPYRVIDLMAAGGSRCGPC